MVCYFVCFLLFLGLIAKSVQFLLHVWLPNALEGPIRIFALIMLLPW
jgi:NADH-quinone oxidoreductase subunit L